MTPEAAQPSAPHYYKLFGLTVRSDFPLPELPELPEPAGAASAVTIEIGDVASPPVDEAPIYSVLGGEVISVAGVASYAILGGVRIIVDPVANTPDNNVRLFLLGSAMGMLLHQRGLLPLHANAVEIDGMAFAFMGPSGAGKSTLAAWFHDRGYRVIADDVCVVTPDKNGALFMINPGLPRLRLWKDAIEASGRDASDYSRSYAGRADYDKFDVPIGSDDSVREPVGLGGIYVLSRGEPTAIDPLEEVAAFDAIFANTYRGEYVDRTSSHLVHWEASLKLAKAVPVFQFTRRWNFSYLGEDMAVAIAHAKSVAGGRSSR